MSTTPPFMPGEIPGLGSSQGVPVPGIPAAPQGQTGGAPPVDPQKILAALLQASQRKQMANTAVPSPVPSGRGGDPMQAGMQTGNPHAWGGVRFAGAVGSLISTAVAAQKRNQLLKAEGDWTYLQSSMNELYAAQQSGNPEAVKAAQAKVDVVLTDPKKLKNMAKALNQDWLNPEKTTVYGEAFKKSVAKADQQAQQEGQKQNAAQKLKDMFRQVLGQKQQLQMTLEQKERMAREIEKKAPTTTSGLDKESMALREEMRASEKTAEDQRKEAAKAKEDEAKAAAKEKELQQKADLEKETLEMKNKFQLQRDKINNDFHQTMETMKERSAEQRQNSHDLMMMKALGLKLDAAQEKLFKPDPQKLNKDVTDSVASLKTQFSAASSHLKSLQTSASNHWIMGPGKEEIKDAQEDVDKLQKAIAHIERNRDDIIKGKADLGDVVNKAYDIMQGGGEMPPPPPVPGAIVTGKP